jgi:hypothetical protein
MSHYQRMDLLGLFVSHWATDCSGVDADDMVVGDKEEFLIRLYPMASYIPSLSDFPATANFLPRDPSRKFFGPRDPSLTTFTTFMGKGLKRGILLYPFILT